MLFKRHLKKLIGQNKLFLIKNGSGLNDMAERRVVRNYIDRWKVDIICLHETKLHGGLQDKFKQIWEEDGSYLHVLRQKEL